MYCTSSAFSTVCSGHNDSHSVLSMNMFTPNSILSIAVQTPDGLYVLVVGGQEIANSAQILIFQNLKLWSKF